MSKTEAILHPLCLLSVVDHFNRVAKDFASRRVVGVLLGSRTNNGTIVDIANSFGVPFEEKNNEPDVWFLDHNYLETMYRMFRKVNNKEEIVGFYSTGPLLKKNDLKIRSLIKRFTPNEPIFMIIDVRSGVEGIPTTAYEAAEEVNIQTREISWVFKHIPCRIEAEESEAVGVEHLVRDINDPCTSTLALQIQQKINGLSGLVTRLTHIREYLEKVNDVNNAMPVNNQIVYNLQNILNLLPNLNIDILVRSMQMKTNDMHLAMYVTSLIRSVIALHTLLLNKVKYKNSDDIIDGDGDGTGNLIANKDRKGKGKEESKTDENGESVSAPTSLEKK